MNREAKGTGPISGERKGRVVLWAGLALVVLALAGTSLWQLLSQKPTTVVGPDINTGVEGWVLVATPQATSAVVAQGNTPTASTSLQTPAPSATLDQANLPPENTPTLIPGGATFTPAPDMSPNAGGKPRVLGITAGVGMRVGDVAGTAPLAVTFSDAMDQASAQAAFGLNPAATGNFAWKANTLLFTPDRPLSPSTSYTVTLAGQARSQAGETVASPLSASFKTAPPPSILRTLPSQGASDVPTDTIVTLTFNRPMIPLMALDSQPDPGQWASISPAVKGRWVWLGTSAVGFRADEGFLPATGYTVAAKAGWPDADGVTMPQGASANFITVRPAILSVSPSNHANGVDLDAPVVVEFNMPMDHASVQSALNLPVAATPAWSSDSTVVTFTLNSLLSFSKTYSMQASGKVRPINGVASDLAGDAAANTWSFTTTSSTEVSSYYPNNDNGPAQPADSFSFSFNNPLAPNQDVARLLMVDPARLLMVDPLPSGYNNKLEVDESNVYTGSIKLLPDTTYKFELKAGLKDKWGFPVTPSRWEVKVGPLPPSVQFPGGGFQPVYVDGPSRVRLDATNVATVTLRLYSLTDKDMSDMLAGVPRTMPGNSQNNVPYGTLKREWTVQVPKSGDGKASVLYPAIDLDGKSGRLPGGYYGLVVGIDNPYNNNGPTEARTVLIVGRTGVVVKIEGRNLFVWAADLGSGKPVAGYKLRVEQTRQGSQSAATVQRGVTGKDGVLRLALDPVDGNASTVVWSDQPNDAMVAATGWSRNLYFGYSGGEGSAGERASVYTDRPIYRPAQVVYFRGAYRMDDDARYSLAPAGQAVALRAFTYSREVQTAVYTGTSTLSPLGTISGQFTLPADAPTGDYTLSMDGPGQKDPQNYSSLTTVSFRVEEYRKPDFQVGVTARDSVVHGDPVTATIASSYYFGGPLSNVTATVNLRSDPYYFGWSDPVTGESYSFGLYTPPIYDFYRPGPPQGERGTVQSLQVRTGPNGIANVDVSRFVTTTEGSRTLLVEGQVQDLSNQAVANSTSVVVHQGSFYVGLRVSDYLAEAKQPITLTVRTVDSSGTRLQPNAAVTLHFVRHEWHAPALGSQDAWQVTDVPAGDATVTTDANGRAIYRFTPQEAGSYGVLAESRDSRGNAIKSSYDFYVYSQDPGFVPWRFSNEQQVQLVADKKEYKAGDVARILVTSPFTQAMGLLTVERGHVKRYRIVTLTGSAPTLDVPLEDGDLPNVFVGLTLLGKGQPPTGAPADWANKVSMRQGYVPLSLDTSGKKLTVSIEPQGKGPFEPGTTASVRVTTHDASGKPAPGELSLAVVDEAIYALTADNATPLFDAFWGERGLGVNTSSSFTSSEGDLALSAASEAMPMMGAGAAPSDNAKRDAPAVPSSNSSGSASPAAPQKVRADFRDTAFWQATVTTGADGIATVAVPLPDNLTTWRLTAHGINGGTQAGEATTPMTVTQPLLLRPVQPRFFTVGDNPQPQAIIHNNTGETLTVEASLEISGSLSFPPASVTGPGNIVRLKIQPGTQAVATWMVSVGKGDVANLRYWVHTVGNAGQPGYREDAVSAHIPVKAFAAPEAVATSGEVSGTSSDESIFLPYSVNPLLGEMVVQVSPSLAAAATNSIHFLEDYPYDSTDMAVSRFLPLVTLEKVYNEQGLKTPYAAQIPGILSRSIKRLEGATAAGRRLGMVGAWSLRMVGDRIRGAGPGGCKGRRLYRARRYATARHRAITQLPGG